MRDSRAKFPILILIIILGYTLLAVDTWQGNAAMIRRGEFESSGMYAASNSFTPNSKVRITNKITGQSVEVIIKKRIEDATNVLLLLSEEASSVIGLGPSDVVNVDVALIRYGYDEIVGLPDDLPFNPDPDIYPATEDIPSPTPVLTLMPTPVVTPIPTLEPTPMPSLEPTAEPTPEPTEEPTAEPRPEPTEEPSEEPSPEPTPEATEEPTPEATEEPTPVPTEEPTPVPTEEPTPEVTVEPTMEPSPIPTPAITAEPTLKPVPEPTLIPFAEGGVLTERKPQKNFYLPPREDETFFLSDLFVSDEKDSDKFPVDEADIEGEASVVSQSIEAVRPKEKDLSLYLNRPSVESPVAESYETPTAEERKIDYSALKIPSLLVKEDAKPEVLLDNVRAEEKKHDFTTTEPDVPGEKSKVLEDSPEFIASREKEDSYSMGEPDLPGDSSQLKEVSGIYMRAEEARVSILPTEPLLPQEKASSRPEVFADFPIFIPEEMSFMVASPVLPDKEAREAVPSGEMPKTEESYVAFNTSEPVVPDKDSESRVDISSKVPDPDYKGEMEVVLEPTEPKPPGEGPQIVLIEDIKTDTDKIETDPLSIEKTLEKGHYFVQLGAYTDSKSARKLSDKFNSLYPVQVIASSSMKIQVFKVLLGPLTKDESDTLLHRSKALGYRDAFVKYIN